MYLCPFILMSNKQLPRVTGILQHIYIDRARWDESIGVWFFLWICNGTNRDFKKWKYGASLRCLPAPKRRFSGTSRVEITFGKITCKGKRGNNDKCILYSATQNSPKAAGMFLSVTCAKPTGGSGFLIYFKSYIKEDDFIQLRKTCRKGLCD